MSVASPAILSNFFGEQGRQNHPQYLSGLSRALFPTTFLETAVYTEESGHCREVLSKSQRMDFLSTGTKKSGRCREVAVVERF